MAQAAAVKRLVDHWSRQGHVFTWAEAQRLGVDGRTVGRLVRQGLIVRLHRGVYAASAVASDPVVVARAALRAAERHLSGAKWQPLRAVAASHRTAAWAQGLLDRPPAEVHITVTTTHALRLRGVVVHRSGAATLSRQTFRGLACTVPARTLVDLAGNSPYGELADAVDRALSARIVRLSDLRAATAHADFAGRRGVARLRRGLDARGDSTGPAPSVLESRMARLFLAYGLPPAKAEYVVGSDGQYRLDYAYPPESVAVELYGYASHHSPEQLAYDLARQRRLVLQGWTVLIFTWLDVTCEPERVAEQLRQALGAARTRQVAFP